ncbi:LOW QUALITY PROTEIN: UDP-glycosyltransferase UGT4 [Daphnia magna]|uniref:LOW QUALITY PROTEIN: UDP-glycosyltransferase UGT4 n=1 Tax=Daphnia magna TaxID=35525 RepID=UPI001E1BD43E|nr:LOW QUALITY PROTEIN: UDP-glycosyltransferase UGT4 [Daphnia magna]
MACKYHWVIIITFQALLFADHGHSHRILAVMPYASTSHKSTIVPLISALAARGHHVTYVSGKPTEQLQNKTNVREIVIDMKVEFTVANRGAGKQSFFENIVERPFKTKMAFLEKFREVPESTINSTFKDPQIRRMMEKEEFDLVLISVITAYVGYPLAWHFNCPFVIMSPNVVLADMPFVMGDSEHTEYVPFIMSGFTHHMSLMQRTINTALVHLTTKIPKSFNTPVFDKLVQHYLPACPPLLDIEHNVSLVFTNTHPSISYPRASPPSLIEVGAIHCRPAQTLPTDMEDFINDGGNAAGFLVFTVGSVIQMDEMPEKILNVFKNVFSRLPQKVIWQWKTQPKNQTMPPNVMLSSWLPQQDLLGHPKCRGFLTHGGLLSTQEAVYHGVPVIGIPFVTDQENNMIKAVMDGYAIKLAWNDIDEEQLHGAILDILNEEKYQLNVKRLQSLLRDQPETPLERAVFWTEYVLRNKGAAALQLGSRNLSRFQRNLLDVYCVLFTILLCITATIICIVKTIRRTQRSFKQHNK